MVHLLGHDVVLDLRHLSARWAATTLFAAPAQTGERRIFFHVPAFGHYQ